MRGSRRRPLQTSGGSIGGSQWGFVALLLVVGGIVAGLLLLLRTSGGSREPYSIRSGAPSGLLGLRLWLEDMGYRVVVGDTPEAAPEADVIFLFPDADFAGEQVRRLSQRVDEGATLVLAGAESPDLTRTFGALIQRRQPIENAALHATQPILTGEQELSQKLVSGYSLGAMPATYLTPALATGDGKAAVLVGQRKLGAVWHVGIRPVFTNQELAGGWGRLLVLAALRGKPSGSTVYIVNGEVEGRGGQPVSDRSGQIDGLGQWLVRQPLGWAALLLAGLLLFYLFTQGRRLGPAILLSDPHRRRTAIEHIEAMANLAQRAGHRDGVARYQKARLRRRLGQAWRVSAELDDAAFVAALSDHAQLPPAKAGTLADLLAKFDRVRDESELVHVVDAASRFTLE